MRVRDVGTTHPPLIGLPGRIGPGFQGGSHPGPLSFYALAPVYRLLGSSSWALQASTVVLHVAAIAVALVIARRRGGVPLMVAVASVTALVVLGYGSTALTEPWNPWLPPLWWVVLLLAVWSVACGDLPMLPVAVVAATYCAQTHVPYLSLAVGLGGCAAGAAIWAWRKAPTRSVQRTHIVRWILGSLALGLVLWAPPTYEELTREPGNYRVMLENLGSPSEETVGLSAAGGIVVRRLDIGHLVVDQVADPGTLIDPFPSRQPSLGRGWIVLIVWLASAFAAVRMRHRALVLLHATVAVGLLLAWWTISRIYGIVWYYLVMWMWGIAIVMMVAVGWTLVLVAARWRPSWRSIATVPLGGLLVLTAALAGRATVRAADAEAYQDGGAKNLRSLAPITAEAIDRGEGAASGHEGRYLITCDSAYLGAGCVSMLNELDRRGFDVGLEERFRAAVGGSRIVEPGESTATIHVASGSSVATWRADRSAVEVAAVEPRTNADVERYEQVRSELIGVLTAAGRVDLVPAVDTDPVLVSLVPDLPSAAGMLIFEMDRIPKPMAVFIAVSREVQRTG